MLKRFVGTKSGKKQNKSGVILVTILFILAVAFVLIGAALMMTANTRKRLYSFAEGGQARITCTAAAQLFQTALEEQQIRDSDFKSMCDSGTVIYFTDPSNKVPGMGGAETASPNNYTKAKFGKSGSLYTVRITTKIGDEVENILLTYQGTIPTVQQSPFAFQVELGEGGRLERTAIGAAPGTSTRASADDNLVVSRGTGDTPVDSTYFYSTFVTTQPFYAASGVHLHGDIVYAGPNAAVDTTHVGGTGGGNMFDGTGYAFFINCNSGVYGAGSTHESFTSNGNITRIIFSGVGDTTWNQAFSGFGANSVYLANSNGTITSDQSVIATGDPGASPATGKTLSYYTGNLDQYLDPNYVNPDTGDTRPSTYREFAATLNGSTDDSVISSTGTCPSTATHIDLSTTATYNAGSYWISGTMGTLDSGPTITINVGGGDVFIYIKDDLTIQNGYFFIKGGTGTNTGHKAYFIICPGESITINPGNGSAPRGIVCENVHTGGAYTGAINGTQAPSCYIIGAGDGNSTALQTSDSNDRGQITINGNANSSYIEAMVALYPNTEGTSGTNDAGDFFVLNGDAVKFYGRIIADTVRSKQANFLNIPYCPQFSSSEDPNILYRVTTNFTLKDFDYYYDDGSTHVLSTAPSST